MTSHSGPGKTWAADSANSTADPDFPQAWQDDIGLLAPPAAAAFIAPASQAVNLASANQAPLADQGSPVPPTPPTPPGLPFPFPGQDAWVYASQAAAAVEKLGLDDGLTALYLKQLPEASQTSAFWALYQNFANLSPDGRSVAVEVVAKDGDNASLLQELQALGLQDGSSMASGVRGWLPIDQLGALVGLSDFDQAHVLHPTIGPWDNSDYPWLLLSDDAEQIIDQTAARGLDATLSALYLEHSSYAAETEPFWSTTSQSYVSADGTEVAIVVYARDGNGATLLQELEALGLQAGFTVPSGGLQTSFSVPIGAGGELPIDQLGALLDLPDFGGARESLQPVTLTYADGSPIRPSSVVLWDPSQATPTHIVFDGDSFSTYLYGAPGNDPVLTGGVGHNTFVFESGWGNDTIMGWTSGVSSTIDLMALASAGIHGLSDLTQTIVDGSDVITSSHTGANSITVSGVGAPLTGSSFRFG